MLVVVPTHVGVQPIVSFQVLACGLSRDALFGMLTPTGGSSLWTDPNESHIPYAGYFTDSFNAAVPVPPVSFVVVHISRGGFIGYVAWHRAGLVNLAHEPIFDRAPRITEDYEHGAHRTTVNLDYRNY